MSIESKGPGNVGNSYGSRGTNTPRQYDTAGVLKSDYQEYVTQAERTTAQGVVSRDKGLASVIWFGDSRTAQATKTETALNATCVRKSASSHATWAPVLMDQRASNIYRGRDGRTAQAIANNDTTASVNDTLAYNVIDPDASDVCILIGTNDISINSRTGAQVVADIRTIANAAKDAGKRVTVLGDYPQNSGGGNWSAAKGKQMLLMSEGLQTLSQAGEFYFIDLAPLFTDYTITASYEGKAAGATNLVRDGVHFNNRGGYFVGKLVAEHYNTIMRPQPIRLRHQTDNSGYDASNLNLLAGYGDINNATYSSWTKKTVAGAITSILYSNIPAPDGNGLAIACDIEYNAALNTDLFFRSGGSTTRFVAGYEWFGDAKVWVQGLNGTGNPSNVSNPYLRVNVVNQTGLHQTDLWPEYTTSEGAIDEPWSGTLRTQPYTVVGNESGTQSQWIVALKTIGNGSCRLILGANRVIRVV